MSEPDSHVDPWLPIETLPNDERLVCLRWRDGGESVEDIDHDSDVAWWRKVGVTHWRWLTEAEQRAYDAEGAP
jgi:hypothetical protein